MTPPPASPRDRRAGWTVALAVFLLTLAASPPTFPRSSDARAMFATAQSLVDRGSLAIDSLYLDDDIPVNPSAKAGPDGRAYAKYGLGWPLVLAGVLLAAGGLGLAASSGPVQAALLALNPLLTAAAAAVAVAIARELGASRRQAALLGLGGALATFAWHVGTTDGADALMTLLVTLSLWACLRHARTLSPRHAALAGGALGAALVAKSSLLVLAPGVLLSLAAAHMVAGSRAPAHGAARPAVRAVAACGAALSAGLGLALWSNHARWGSPFASGYNEPVLTGDLAFGLWQLTVGVNKGLVVYAPVAALGLLALVAGWRRHVPWTIAAGLGALGLLASTAKFYDFGGGWTYGPRYLLPVVPALAASIAPLLRARAGRLVAGLALTAGLATSVPGVLIDVGASRTTFANAWLPEASGLVRSGDTHRPGVIVERPRPVEDAVPEFAGPVVNLWLLRVLTEPCACSREAWWCACADGRDMYWNARFRSPPWASRYPEVEARPPYGQDLLGPALLSAWYRRAVFDVAAVAPPDPAAAAPPAATPP